MLSARLSFLPVKQTRTYAKVVVETEVKREVRTLAATSRTLCLPHVTLTSVAASSQNPILQGAEVMLGWWSGLQTFCVT